MKTKAGRRYRAAVTLYKAAVEFVVVWFGVGAGLAAVDLPDSWEGFQRRWPLLVVPFVLAAVRAVRNFQKQVGLRRSVRAFFRGWVRGGD